MARSTLKVELALLACFLAAAHALEYAGPGPCSSSVSTMEVKLPKEYICKCQCDVRLIVTVPANGCSVQGPYPTILFSSGFQATSENYKQYAERLASWGFAVVQYDFLKLSPWIDGLCHSDAAEAGFMLKFLVALQKVASDPSSELYGKLDLTNLGAAGHSRGGKIAALHFAGTTPNVNAAYLVDPVDGFALTQGKIGYPSAVKLLRDRSKKIGMTAAGKIALCNGKPFATGNWTDFWEVSDAGSELQVVLNAGHLQFVEIKSSWDTVCCTGCQGLISQQEGIELALTPMVAWFQKELRQQKRQASLADQPGFTEWVCANEEAMRLTYVVRGRGQICPGGKPAAASKHIPLLHIDAQISFPESFPGKQNHSLHGL